MKKGTITIIFSFLVLFSLLFAVNLWITIPHPDSRSAIWSVQDNQAYICDISSCCCFESGFTGKLKLTRLIIKDVNEYSKPDEVT